MKHPGVQTDNPGNSRASAALLVEAMEQFPEAFYCLAENGEILHSNGLGQTMLGADEGSLIGSSILDKLPEISKNRWKSAANAAKEKGRWLIQTEHVPSGHPVMTLELCIEHRRIDEANQYFCIARKLENLNEPERFLGAIARASAGNSGEEFLASLMQQMAKALHVNVAFVTECVDQPPTKVRIVASWTNGIELPDGPYDLVKTPCEVVMNEQKEYFVGSDLAELYPVEQGIGDSYFGVPIFDSKRQKIIGHMAFLDDQYITVDRLDCTIFDILKARASVELQRLQGVRALEKSESKYRMLVDNQTDLILRLDSNARLGFVSPSCCHRFGKSEGELLETSFFNLIHQSEIDQAREAWKSAAQPPYHASCEIRSMTAQGWCWFSWVFKGVEEHQGDAGEVIAVARDISARVRAESQARDTIKKLAHVGRVSSMGEMATGLAHELNQPLTAILSFAQASQRLMSDGKMDIQEQASILERIAANAELAGDIIQRMRGFVRKSEPGKLPVDLVLLIKEVVEMLGTELRHGEISLNLALERALPRVLGDRIQIQQVLVNLVRNAIEAMTEHKSPKPEIVISASNLNPDTVLVKVKDSGPGIEPEIKKRLFDTFVSTKADGLGVGLSICQTIIEAHGGKLIAKSTLGSGSQFSFKLPVSGGE